MFVWICVNIYFGDKWHNRVTQYLSKWLWGYNNIDSLLLQMINTTLSYARQAALCTDHSSTFTRSHLWLETLIYSVIFHSVIFYYYLLCLGFRPFLCISWGYMYKSSLEYMIDYHFTKLKIIWFVFKGQIISNRFFLAKDLPKNERKHVAY